MSTLPAVASYNFPYTCLPEGVIVNVRKRQLAPQDASVEIADYHEEVARHARARPADYHPATASEPRRVLTWDGEVLTGSNNGEGRSDWAYQSNVTVHTAVTGSGYAYGISVAACNGSLELGYDSDLSNLVKLSAVDKRLLCRRSGCRAMREVPIHPAAEEAA